MADSKISALPASTTPLAGTEVLPIVQSSTTKQVSVANLTAGRAVSALSLSLTTALPVASGGTGVASSTGTVAVVLSTSPTLITPTISGYTESVVACGTAGVVGASFTFVITAGTVLTAILTASTPCTFAMPTSPVAGQSFILLLTQAATGMTTATFTGVKWPGGTVPTITATASAVDIISFVYIGTAWYGNAAQAFA